VNDDFHGLIAVIDQNFKDDTPHLVLADLIEEQGSPSVAKLVRDTVEKRKLWLPSHAVSKWPVRVMGFSQRNINPDDQRYYVTLSHPRRGTVTVGVVPKVTGGDVDSDHPHSDRPVVGYWQDMTPEAAHEFADGLPNSIRGEFRSVLRENYKYPDHRSPKYDHEIDTALRDTPRESR
jgi:uncharacterized protein (TIGR02996 family)